MAGGAPFFVVSSGRSVGYKFSRREMSFMIMGQNIWLVIIVVFLILAVLGVITVAA